MFTSEAFLIHIHLHVARKLLNNHQNLFSLFQNRDNIFYRHDQPVASAPERLRGANFLPLFFIVLFRELSSRILSSMVNILIKLK